jgi:hypothetical protein
MRAHIAVGIALAIVALACSDSTTEPNDPVLAALLTPGPHAFSGGDSTCSALGELFVTADSMVSLTVGIETVRGRFTTDFGSRVTLHRTTTGLDLELRDPSLIPAQTLHGAVTNLNPVEVRGEDLVCIGGAEGRDTIVGPWTLRSTFP